MSEYISRDAAILWATKALVDDFDAYNVKASLQKIRAADVVEVVHASWVWNPDGMDWGIGAWVCGKCKSRPETWWNTVKESHPLRCSGSRYCGNCGAKMDGDGE